MGDTKIFFTAATPFEAARHVAILPVGHRSRRLHGHSFLAKLRANIPSDWGPFDGGEVDELRSRLRVAVEPLDYRALNEMIEHPTDENIARWLGSRLDVPGIESLGIQSTNDEGVDLDR